MFSASIWGTVSDWFLVILATGTVAVAWFQIKKASEATNQQIKTSNENNLAQIEAAAKASREEINTAVESNHEQLKATAKAGREQAEIARATLLLEIDRDFESADMQESRMALRGLRNEIEALCGVRYKDKNDAQKEEKCHELFSDYMNKLWRDFKKADETPETSPTLSDSEILDVMKDKHVEKVNQNLEKIQPHEKAGTHYQRLTRLLGWLERVGHMANQGLIPESDAIKLYDVIFVKMGSQFEGHIVFRRNEGNANFMKEFMTFRERIIQQQQEETATKLSAEKTARTRTKATVFTPRS